MKAHELHRGMQRAARWGVIVGAAGSIAALTWAIIADPSNVGTPREFVGMALIFISGGAALFTMMYIKGTSWDDLRSAIGVGRSVLYAVGLFVAMVVALVVAKLIAGF